MSYLTPRTKGPLRDSHLVAVLVSVLALAACPDDESKQNTDGGSSNSGTGGNATQLEIGCGGDQECAAGEICEIASGNCVAGLDCSQNGGICSFCDDDTTGCGFVGAAYCATDAGVCRRTGATCDACNEDSECGTASNGLPNRCVAGFCAEGCGACPAGFRCEQGGCVPVESAGSCESAILCREGESCPDGQRCSDLGVCLSICDNDSECPPGKICSVDPGPLLGQCLNGCPFGDSIMSNGETRICHANGRYGTPCTTPESTEGCPTGTVCETNGACGLQGCQTDSDCPLVRTYCDVSTGECREGCNDPSDCGAFELCEDSVCVAQGCRGKEQSCNLGEWCCGKETFSDAATCPTGVADGNCFVSPEPWCRPCNDNNDCADIQLFGFTSYCFELNREDDQGNSVSLGKYCSVGCESNADCPRGLQCVLDLPTDQEGVTTQGCLGPICQPLSEARTP